MAACHRWTNGGMVLRLATSLVAGIVGNLGKGSWDRMRSISPWARSLEISICKGDGGTTGVGTAAAALTPSVLSARTSAGARSKERLTAMGGVS
jgi:hypothetical protein